MIEFMHPKIHNINLNTMQKFNKKLTYIFFSDIKGIKKAGNLMATCSL